MTVTNYQQWVNDGSPFMLAAPVACLVHILDAHGYTVGTIGNKAHLQAAVPEDHTPYSHTPWPGSQPYPNVMALDIMPGGSVDLATLGSQIYQDKMADIPGVRFIKYMNWTDKNGNCWHDSWEPNHSRRASTDTGHIHISVRTDYVHTPTTYDPVEEATMPSIDDIKAVVHTEVQSLVTNTNSDATVGWESPVGGAAGKQQWPDWTQGGKLVPFYIAFGNLSKAFMAQQATINAIAAKLGA